MALSWRRVFSFYDKKLHLSLLDKLEDRIEGMQKEMNLRFEGFHRILILALVGMFGVVVSGFVGLAGLIIAQM